MRGRGPSCLRSSEGNGVGDGQEKSCWYREPAMMVTAVPHNIGDLTAYLDAGVADMAELR